MQQKRQRSPAIFSIFAPSDIQYLEQWEAHLRPLEQAGIISAWSERHLQAGVDRLTLLHEHLDQADIIVLLLSADFFTDDECYSLMERALARHQEGTARLIPLQLRPVSWRETKLASFTPLPADGRAITLWENPEAALDDCVRELRRILGRSVTASLPQNPKRASIEEQNRARMLRRLRRSYNDLMSQSLQGAAWLELGLADKPDAVQNAANLLLRMENRPERPLPPGTSITKAYDEAEHELLILGEPGAGKSTLLLDLGQELVGRAERDETHLLPVILPLSSWAIKRGSLEDWITEQMSEIYDVPRKVSREWVKAGRILPLLDGLDEMEENARPVCIERINAYHHDHMTPLVICSRRAEYEAASEHHRLALQSAVVVQPLAHKHVDTYLAQGGKPLTALRSTLKKNATLHDLATTPLMLNILTLTYQGTLLRSLPTQGSLLLQQIWNDYVERMVIRKGNSKHYPLERTRAYLGYLARQMRKRNQTVFYLEHLQSDWLTSVQQHTYVWLAIRLPAVLIGLLASLTVAYLINDAFSNPDQPNPVQYVALGGLLGWLFSRPPSRGGSQQEQFHRRPELWYHFSRYIPLGTIIGLIFGLSFGPRALGWYLFDWVELQGYGPSEWLRDGPIYGYVMGISSLVLSWILPAHPGASTPPTTRAKRPWSFLVHLIQTIHGQRTWRVVAVLGVGYGVSYVLSGGSPSGPGYVGYELLDGLLNGLNVGLSIGIISIMVSLLLEAQAKGIVLTDRLRWTRSSLMRSLLTPKHMRETFLITGALGMGFGLREGLGNGLSQALICGLLYWLVLGLFQGVSSERIEDQTRRLPNQGIRRSLYNSVILALISGTLIGVIDRLSFILGNGLNYALNFTFFGPSEMLKWGLYGLGQGMLFVWPSQNTLVLAVCFGLLVCASRGGLAVLRHYVIRWLLQHAGSVPHHYIRFLDEAASCILLQKVGGGYSFVHRILLEYFADAEIRSSEDASEVTATSGPPSALSSTAQIDPVHEEGKTSSPVPSREPSVNKKNRIAALLVVLVFLGTSILSAQVHEYGLQQHNNAQSTAYANFANDATTIAKNATAQPKTNATAEAFANASPIAYPPQNTPPVLNDPLQDNSKGAKWQIDDPSNGNCKFISRAYDINTNADEHCFARATDFANFIYEVQMKLVKGDGGGIAFRCDPTENLYYYFAIKQDGSYGIYDTGYSTSDAPNGIVLAQGSSSAIHRGLNQTNLIAAAVRGEIIELYVNHTRIAIVGSNAYTHGRIGVVVTGDQNQTEVIFQNAKVWKL